MVRFSLGVGAGQGQFSSSSLVTTTLFWKVKELIMQTLPFSLQPIDRSVSIVTISTSPNSITWQKWKISHCCAEPPKSKSLLSATAVLGAHGRPSPSTSPWECNRFLLTRNAVSRDCAEALLGASSTPSQAQSQCLPSKDRVLQDLPFPFSPLEFVHCYDSDGNCGEGDTVIDPASPEPCHVALGFPMCPQAFQQRETSAMVLPHEFMPKTIGLLPLLFHRLSPQF